MAFKKTWERYFLRETLSVFSLIIFCFYGLFVLIDYASHNNSKYYHSQMNWTEVIHHYANEFIQRADVLIPFALLVATIRTLCSLNIHNELIALMASGTSIKRLLRPFLLIGLFFTALIYINTEFFIPKALENVRHLYNEKTLIKLKKRKKIFVQNIALNDGSTLLFQDYDKQNNRFIDAFWVKNFNEIWHFQYLYPYPYLSPTKAINADLLERASPETLTKTASFSEHLMPEIEFNSKVLLDTLTPPKELPLSLLWKKLPSNQSKISEKQAEISSAFYHKMALPWLCFLAVLFPAPFCVRYSRVHSVFFIYSFSIFALVACYLTLNAALILGERQILPSFWALFIPIFLFLSVSVRNFVKL